MFRINGLEEYVKRAEFLEELDIPSNSKIDFQLLAQGEYNINYLFTHPVTKEKLILRVNHRHVNQMISTQMSMKMIWNM